MSFPTYPKYKDSGVDWLGEVPEHWEVAPLKRLASFTNGAAFKPTDWADSGYPIIRIENLNGGESFNYFGGEPEDQHLVRDGDLLFGWSGNRGTSFGPYRWRRDEVCVLNQHIFNVASDLIETNALYWILKAVTAHVEDQAHGIIGMVHVTKSDLGAIKVPVPSSSERKAISLFLDHETAKIDALIAEQQRLITLLLEKRQRVIFDAVTKGLNSDAAMKDSGIEWVGQVPQRWQVDRLKWSTVGCINGVWGDDADGLNDIICVRVADFDRQRLAVDDSPPTLRAIRRADRLRRLLQPGDLLLEKSGGGERQLVGCVVVFEHSYQAVCSNFIARVSVAPDMYPRYWAFLHAAAYSARLNYRSIKQTTGIQNLDAFAYMNEKAPYPPFHEQKAIAGFLDEQTSKFDDAAKEVEAAIERLQEFRSALITAAVTGQIDVRKEVA